MADRRGRPGHGVTAVVPTHNRPAEVTAAVRSIVEQDHDGPIEVIVVFDKSEPHEIDVPLAEGRMLRVLVNEHRSPGLAGARNTGILEATQPWIAFCDDDDSWRPGKLRAQLSALDAHGATAASSTGIMVRSDGGLRHRTGPARPLGLRDFLEDRIMAVHSSSLLFPAETLINEIGLVDEQTPGSYGEDYDLLLRTTKVCPIINVPEPLVDVEFGGDGSFYAERWRMIEEGLEYLLAQHPEFDEVPRGRARIEGQIAFARAAMGDRRGAWRAIRRTLRHHPGERRAFAALLVAAGMPVSWLTRALRARGRGI